MRKQGHEPSVQVTLSRDLSQDLSQNLVQPIRTFLCPGQR